MTVRSRRPPASRVPAPVCRPTNAAYGLPYPAPASEGVTACMQGNRRADTVPEKRLRRLLHSRGLRFRKDFYLKLTDCRVHADVAFTRKHVAVFLDGCFWHGCPQHSQTPKRNAS